MKIISIALLFSAAVADSCGDKYKSQSSCDGDSTCTWCKCAALPSACWTKANAKSLPSGVYQCDSNSVVEDTPNRRKKAYVNLDTIRDVNSHPRPRRQSVEQCVLSTCAGDAIACLGDGDCAVKINCALSCTTADCANACAGDSPSAATTALLSCAVANSCVSSKFDSDVVVKAIASYKAKQTPAECAQASCPGDAFSCLLDADCSSKIGCALNCATVDCINACAEPSPSSVTSSLISCAISSGCVSGKREGAVTASPPSQMCEAGIESSNYECSGKHGFCDNFKYIKCAKGTHCSSAYHKTHPDMNPCVTTSLRGMNLE